MTSSFVCALVVTAQTVILTNMTFLIQTRLQIWCDPVTLDNVRLMEKHDPSTL